jgi:hypothetical protein
MLQRWRVLRCPGPTPSVVDRNMIRFFVAEFASMFLKGIAWCVAVRSDDSSRKIVL